MSIRSPIYVIMIAVTIMQPLSAFPEFSPFFSRPSVAKNALWACGVVLIGTVCAYTIHTWKIARWNRRLTNASVGVFHPTQSETPANPVFTSHQQTPKSTEQMIQHEISTLDQEIKVLKEQETPLLQDIDEKIAAIFTSDARLNELQGNKNPQLSFPASENTLREILQGASMTTLMWPLVFERERELLQQHFPGLLKIQKAIFDKQTRKIRLEDKLKRSTLLGLESSLRQLSSELRQLAPHIN